MNELGLVVSRYYEDLNWIENIVAPIDVYIYNRQGESPNMGVPNAVAWAKPKKDIMESVSIDLEKCKNNGINLIIENIPDDPGFECSTYAYHCYSKYKNLNDYTIFVQAHPWVYVKDFMSILSNYENIKYTKYKRGSEENLSPSIRYISDSFIDFEPFCDQFGTVIPTIDYGWCPYKSDFNKIPWLEFCKHMPNSIIDNNNWVPPNSWNFGAGNQFIASKIAIQRNQPKYYKKIQNFCNTYMDPNGDERPQWQQLNQGPNIMEGIWQFIFSKK